MLDELIDRFGSGAVVTASPRMLDSGENYRWELMIDGESAPEVHAHERRVRGRPEERVLLMVCRDDEVELTRWSTKTDRYGPATSIWTLGGLRRHHGP